MHHIVNALSAHEGGHAIVAHHFGLKIKSFGHDPMPHCLISQRGATKEQLGVMLCAGAAATEIMYGERIGHYYDFEMAGLLGDVEDFTQQAKDIITNRWPEFLMFEAVMFGDEHPETLQPNEEGWNEIYDAIQAAKPNRFVRWQLRKMVDMQTKNPQRMAKLANLQQKYIGAMFRLKDALTFNRSTKGAAQ